jgi:hypothetical protein
MSQSTEIANRDPGPAVPMMDRIRAVGVPEKLASTYLAVDPDSDVLEVVMENMGGDLEDLDFSKLPRMKFPTGGEVMFNVPDPTHPNGVVQEKRLTAIMVISQSRRAFWPTVNLTGDRPTCFALDGRNGQGEYGKGSAQNPSGKCNKCPMAQYGTRAQLEGAQPEAAGQACKQTRLLYLLLPGKALPMQLAVPPASLKVIEAFLLQLASAGKPTPFYAIEVELSLQKVGSENPYAELQIATQRVLDPDEVAVTKIYHKALKEQLATTTVDDLVGEVINAEGGGEGGIGFPDAEGEGESATEGGFEDVEGADEGSTGQGAADAATGKARTARKA